MEGLMAATVSRMTPDELREMMASLIEQKLLELLGDPDEDLRIRRSLSNRLLRQKKAVARGQRGEPLDHVVERLGLA
jgi:hypothetical protein